MCLLYNSQKKFAEKLELFSLSQSIYFKLFDTMQPITIAIAETRLPHSKNHGNELTTINDVLNDLFVLNILNESESDGCDEETQRESKRGIERKKKAAR